MIHKQRLSRRDFIKGGVLTIFSTVGVGLLRREQAGEPEWQIMINGKLIQQGSFASGTRQDIYIPVLNGTAHIVLDGDRIFVHEDNNICPKKICSQMGSIRHSGEKITCVPNKLVVRIL